MTRLPNPDPLTVETDARPMTVERLIEKVASEHGIFVGGYSWWCCGPHPGTNEPDEDHSHAEFDFGKKGSVKATRHLLKAILAADPSLRRGRR